ncbi:uncharacterized protein LOC129590032 [Paramacrobiotus metropolitanus]|uniref:uncharacterized protein LOC129590032 n=1 Tax=Paramacrobiotus metropolitanus TaxID=2943436 RepID=UPI002445CF40|nr:uncharacterized protein LOC129590032 [Paramacrobiotus metropolitanus]
MDTCRHFVPAMITLALFLGTSLAIDREDGADGHMTTEHVPFLRFSAEPMTLDQCKVQFTDNCEAPLATVGDCPFSEGLQICCNNNASATEIQQMATAMSQPPLKAIFVALYDGSLINSENFAAIRNQIVILQLFNCTSERAPGKLPSLRFVNLLEFGLFNCYELSIKRSDFWQSMQLRVIEFVNSTVAVLERNTFADLPALRMLSLESHLDRMGVFPEPMRKHLERLHCGCEFAWFRQWWSGNKNLLPKAGDGEIYNIGWESWRNEPRNKIGIYLPIDCAADPFPMGNASVNFIQERFSINEDLYPNKAHQNCTSKDMDSDDSFPDFATEPMNSVKAAVRLLGLCDPAWHAESLNNTQYSYVMLDTCNNSETMFHQLRQQALQIGKLRPRPIEIQFKETTPLTFEHISPIRREIVMYLLLECVTPRATRILATYRLTNLLQYDVFGGTDLDVKTSDFQYSQRLRMVSFFQSTIRTLEEGSFTNLPALKVLTLEGLLNMTELGQAYDQAMQDYLRRLHCSCKFAWYRRWRMNNMSLLPSTANDSSVTTIYRLPGIYNGFTKNQAHKYVRFYEESST